MAGRSYPVPPAGGAKATASVPLAPAPGKSFARPVTHADCRQTWSIDRELEFSRLTRRPIGVAAVLRSIAGGQPTDAPMPRTIIAAPLAAVMSIPTFAPVTAAAAPS